jgi:hypothetical protein
VSNQHVAEQLSPELALVDPELARLARDRLPVPGETLSSATSTSPALATQAPPRLDADTTDRKTPPQRRARRGRRVLLAAVGVVLAMTAIYAFAPASTVRDEFPSRGQKAAPTRTDRQPRSDRQPSPRAPARQTGRSADVGTTRVSRHSTSPTGAKRTRTKSERPSPFATRVFIWPAVRKASFYKVEFFRRGRRVFEALASTPRFELPLRWVYRGRRYRLVEGSYSWRVSPAFGPRSRLRYGNPIIRSIWVARR